jgi:Tfp pilus assembly protein PilF
VRLADAKLVQRRLVEIEPQNLFNYVNLASVSAQMGDYQSAEAALKQAIDMRPDLALPYISLAQLHLQTGSLTQARWFAEGAVRREPTVQGYAVLAAACQQLGDSEGAGAAREMARKLAPDDPRLNKLPTQLP